MPRAGSKPPDYREEIERAAKLAGIEPKGLASHSGRRTVITALYADGRLDLADVARHVGAQLERIQQSDTAGQHPHRFHKTHGNIHDVKAEQTAAEVRRNADGTWDIAAGVLLAAGVGLLLLRRAGPGRLQQLSGGDSPAKPSLP